MKRATGITWILTITLLALIGAQPGQAVEKKAGLATDKAKIGYAIGCDMGTSIRDFRNEIDLESLILGIRDTMAGGDKLRLSPEEMRTVLDGFRQKAAQIMQQKQAAVAARNKTEGEAFLAANGKKPGVKTTASGLQYRVIAPGNGPKPKAGDTVKVHYRGALTDGTEFDSSYRRNQPVTFVLNRVIPGWTEGLQLMPVGAKYLLFVPSKLGYGERGAGQAIGPNAVLVFEVELLAIEKPQPAQPPK